MKPNELVDKMVNDAKVEPTSKPTIPEKSKAPNPAINDNEAKYQKYIKKGLIDADQYEELKRNFKGKDLDTAVEDLAQGAPFGDVLTGTIKYEKYDEPTAREKAEQFAKSKGYTGLDDPEYERAYGPYEDDEIETKQEVKVQGADDNDISEALSDYSWQITEGTSAWDYAKSIAKKMKVDPKRVFEIIKSQAPTEINENSDMSKIVFGE